MRAAAHTHEGCEESLQTRADGLPPSSAVEDRPHHEPDKQRRTQNAVHTALFNANNFGS